MLPREVRCRFFQERKFHFQLADAPLEFPDLFRFRHPRRKRLPCYLLPVSFHPEPESGVVDTELAGDLGARPGVIHHFPGGLFLEFRSVPFWLSRHFPRPFPARILLDPLSGNPGAPQSAAALIEAAIPDDTELPGTWPV